MLIRIFGLIIAMVFLAGCGNENTTLKESADEAKVEQKEELKLQTLENVQIAVNQTDEGLKLEGYEDKVVLLNFFATWCPPCKAEIPHFNSLQSAYGDDLAIVSLALEDKPVDELKAFKEFYAINYTITYGEANYALAEALGGVQTIPYTILYDKNGNYATHYQGAVPEEMIEADIKKVLAK